MTTAVLPLLLAVLTAAASYWLTGRLLRYALSRRILDVPNARSLHSRSTPRGGGMAIVVTTLTALAWLAWAGVVPRLEILGLCAAGALVAAVGFADDHRPLRRRWRLLAHFAASAGVLASIAPPPMLPVLGTIVDPGPAGIVVASLYVVWLINLTNFMDGIDGIAALEALTVCVGAIVLHAAAGQPMSAWIAPLVLAAASFGFLLWNWPPAHIFMGDGGSGFLGLMLAALSLAAGSARPELFWAWLVLLGVFVVDATMTLCRRVLRGEPVHEPHRTHAYQHAAMRAGQHRPVTLVVGLINVGWLLPMALLVASGLVDGALGVLIAYAPLAWGAWRLGAGTPGEARPPGSAIV